MASVEPLAVCKLVHGADRLSGHYAANLAVENLVPACRILRNFAKKGGAHECRDRVN